MDFYETSIPSETILIKPTRDEVYYFQNVVFHVGNTLFRVPKNVFNVPGTIFEAMFTLPPTTTDTVEPEGSCDNNPIVLSVDEDDFRGFLRVICGSRAQKLSNEDWLSALNLATMWYFDDVRCEAIRGLDEWTKSQSLKQVILTAKKYNVVTWLKVAYTQLVLNPQLPFHELIDPPAVDWETIAKLLYIKHQHSNNHNYPCCCGGFGDCGRRRICGSNAVDSTKVGSAVDSMVGSIFKAEFDSEVPQAKYPSS